MPEHSPTIIVLASGKGERFRASGGQGSKLHALLDGKRIIDWTLEAVLASGLPFHLEDGGQPGMGDSIGAAVRATPDAHGWLILPADLPLIQPGTLRQVAGLLARHEAVVPTYQDRRGHPVGFSRGCYAALAASAGEQGASHLLARCEVFRLAVDDIGVCTDIDSIEQLTEAEALLRAGR